MEKEVNDLIQELSRLLNHAVFESEEARSLIRAIHSLGYNIQINFNAAERERGAVSCTRRETAEDGDELPLSHEDHLFLKSIRITAEE